MTERPWREWEKLLFAAAIGVTISLVGSGLLLWRSSVSREDVQQMIKSSQTSLQSLSQSVERLTEKLHSTELSSTQSQGRIEASLALLTAKMEAVQKDLERLEKKTDP